MNIRRLPQKRLQYGISLLELMVALAIGLILLLALASLMIVANRSSHNRTTAELMDETARQVFSRLETDLHQAGYVDPFATNDTLVEAFDMSDANRLARYVRQQARLTTADKNQLTLLGRLSQGKLQPVKGCEGELSDSVTGTVCTTIANSKWHTLQVAYQAVRAQSVISSDLASVSTQAQESGTDSNALAGCVNVTANGDYPIIVNIYSFNNADSKVAVTGPRSLRCMSKIANFKEIDPKDRSAEPLMVGIEEMVFRYLVTPDDATPLSEDLKYPEIVSGRSVEKYLSAEEVEKLPLGWASVVGVEVCLIVAVQPIDGRRELNMVSVQPKVPTCLREKGTVADTAFKALDSRPSNWQDLREYRRYVRTITLPNSLYLSNIKL